MKLRKTNNIIGNYVNWLFLLNVVTFHLILRFPSVVLTCASGYGEYGFKCVNDKTYEVLHEDSSETCFSKMYKTGTCPDGTVCDEAYPLFCSPHGRSKRSVTKRSGRNDQRKPFRYRCNHAKKNHAHKKIRSSDLNANATSAQTYTNNLNEISTLKTEINGIRMEQRTECIAQTDLTNNVATIVLNSTLSHVFITSPSNVVTNITSACSATPKPNDSRMYRTLPTYKCSGPGNFPDPNNPQGYIFCDVNEKGDGFIPITRKCPPERVFNAQVQECTLPEVYKLNNTTNLNVRVTRKSFTCRGEGRFPVPHDPTSYYICELSEDGTFTFRKLTCESGTWFDPALKACVVKTISPSFNVRPFRKISTIIVQPDMSFSMETNEISSSTVTMSPNGEMRQEEEIEILVPPPTTPKAEQKPRHYLCHSVGRHADPRNDTVFFVCRPK